MVKFIAVGALVIIIIGGLWLVIRQKPGVQQQTGPAVQISQTPINQTSPLPTSATSSSSQDTSDSALDRDFASTQGNLNKLDTQQKAASADTSTQDTPPAQ